jgi:NADPH2 dehydrogenase
VSGRGVGAGTIPQVRKLRTAAELTDRLDELGVAEDLPLVERPADGADPLEQPFEVFGRRVGNRWAILPMEGWDGTAEGRPSELVQRRWQRFGESGAKLIWGGEAVAVRRDGRANPNQLVIDEETAADLGALRRSLVAAHVERFGSGADDDLLVGLQLTHSGRWSRPGPDRQPRPRTAYRHPLLDPRVGAGDDEVLTDDELDDLVGAYVTAAARARDAGFHFVDVKACHGYLVHELLSGVDRPGRYGGELTGRSAFLRTVLERIGDEVGGLGLAVRLSVFDVLPHHPGADGVGEPDPLPDGTKGYRYAFGGDGTEPGIDLGEPRALLDTLTEAGVASVCVTAGSPYYCPHVQRPAFFPPSDGYDPPEDPLLGVARLVRAAAAIKQHRPDLVVVASGLTYLQEHLPEAARGLVSGGRVDVAGIGRMVLSYHDLPADVAAGQPLDRRRLCRTFSDCTTAPRNGLVSGCWPLDDHYKSMPERARLTEVKRKARRGGDDDG